MFDYWYIFLVEINFYSFFKNDWYVKKEMIVILNIYCYWIKNSNFSIVISWELKVCVIEF